MRWLRLHWRSFSTNMYICEEEEVSKSNTLKSTTDSYGRDKLPQWSTSISGNQSLWCCTRSIGIFQYTRAEWRRSRFRRTMGPITIVSKWNTYRNCLEGFYKSKLQDLFSIRLYWFCTTKKLFETIGNQVIRVWRQLQDFILIKRWELEISESGTRSLREEWWSRVKKRKESLRCEESGSMLSVENEWTMFQRRLVQFQSWTSVWQRTQRTRGSKTKGATVLSRTLIEGKDRRRKNEGNRGTSSSDKGSRIPCRFTNVKKPVMCFRHPPVCQNYKSNTGCRYKCHFRYAEAEEKPNKKS